jgi:hypothetical protein
MKYIQPKLGKYIRLYYDKKIREKPLSINQLEIKYNISHARIYERLEFLDKKYPRLRYVLKHFNPSDLLNQNTLDSIVKRLEAEKK